MEFVFEFVFSFMFEFILEFMFPFMLEFRFRLCLRPEFEFVFVPVSLALVEVAEAVAPPVLEVELLLFFGQALKKKARLRRSTKASVCDIIFLPYSYRHTVRTKGEAIHHIN